MPKVVPIDKLCMMLGIGPSAREIIFGAPEVIRTRAAGAS